VRVSKAVQLSRDRPNSLLPWLDSILLWRNEVEEGFSSRVQLVQLALWGRLPLLTRVLAASVEGPFWFGLLLAKDSKQEGAMVERAIFERVIQFADLRETQGNRQLFGHSYTMHRTRDPGRDPPLDCTGRLHVTHVRPEQERVPLGDVGHCDCYSVLTLDGSNFSCLTSQKSSKSFSHRSRNNQGSSPQHHRCWIFSVSIVSYLCRMTLRKPLSSSITSYIGTTPIP
jgi:hypothetical protein